MKVYNLALIGFGHVGKALVRHLLLKREELRDRYGIEWRLTGVATRRMGWLADPAGLDADALLAGQLPSPPHALQNVEQWLEAAQANVLFELSSTNPHSGQPAIDYIRSGLEHGAHVITANKGPIVHAYQELRDLAKKKGKKFLFEGTVMAGAPLFSLYQYTLPATSVTRFRGLLNSTANVIIAEMEQGRSFDEALRQAQKLGIAETDPSLDVDGWDAAVKVCAIATVLMNVPLRIDEVQREGIRNLTPEQVKTAKAAGKPYKLVAQLERTPSAIVASVRPEQLNSDDPLAAVSPASMLVHLETDLVPGLMITLHLPEEERAGLDATAYDVMADMIRAISGEEVGSH
uniref:Homoserine dehydrogenase n=1 Tax=Thermosporothrix sp. COM3 TaxID=2490863 RepID=A0A455SKB3_9CHLR|nr:homoserine dehydrogenase [Thermosporothrix sp. COM3]